LFRWNYWFTMMVRMSLMLGRHCVGDILDRVDVLTAGDFSFVRFFLIEMMQLYDKMKSLRWDRGDHEETVIGGYMNIAARQAAHGKRLEERKAVQDFLKEFERYEHTDVDFDFAGIRWMSDGRWGENHPCEDLWDPVWEKKGGIYRLYGVSIETVG
ncbi:hypothetical protein PV325_014151, partial [Microctonus aethiopoides]